MSGVLTHVSSFPSPSSFRKVRRGVVLTYVSTWLCLCHAIHLLARCKRGCFLHMSLDGFSFVTPLIFSQSEKGGGFNICLNMAFPLSLHSSSREVQKRGSLNICVYLVLPLSLHSSYHAVHIPARVVTHASTWFSLSILFSQGVGFNICLHGLCLCHSIHLITRCTCRGF